jgi:hypothetical protein
MCKNEWQAASLWELRGEMSAFTTYGCRCPSVWWKTNGLECVNTVQGYKLLNKLNIHYVTTVILQNFVLERHLPLNYM